VCDSFLNKIIIIVKVLSTARSSKLSQIESYVRTLSRKELELQWKKKFRRNSNEDYFRTMNFVRLRLRSNVSESADYQHSKTTRRKDRDNFGSNV